MRSSLLVLLAALGVAVAPAVAQEVSAGSTDLTSAEMVQRANTAISEMGASESEVSRLLDDAKDEGEQETIDCVSLRLSQISTLIGVSSLAQSDMNSYLSAQELQLAGHEFRKIEVAHGKVELFESQAKVCSGQGAVADATSSTQSDTSGDGDDDTQGLGISDGVVGTDPPGTTPFEY